MLYQPSPAIKNFVADSRVININAGDICVHQRSSVAVSSCGNAGNRVQRHRYLATTFSPDGEMIYYVATLERNKFVPTLYRIPVLGGTPAKVLDRVFSAVAFSHDGKQFAFVRRNQDDIALMLANTDGSGQPRTISVSIQPNGFSTSGPSWSPDGKRIACGLFNGTGAGSATVVEVPVEGGDPQPIGSGTSHRLKQMVQLLEGPIHTSLGVQNESADNLTY